jgi:hypothetical protein
MSRFVRFVPKADIRIAADFLILVGAAEQRDEVAPVGRS